MDRFCPACGGALETRRVEDAERQVCARCGRVQYRNSKPAVGAVLLREGRVLLSRRARAPHAGAWDLPGGFLEEGEDPEAGLLREIAEETGLRARGLRLLGVWTGRYGEACTLNLVYASEADGEPVARSDSAELRWWPLDALPADLAFAHEREALERARKSA